MGADGDRPLRVLHVDDDPAFSELVSTMLEREGPFDVETATDPEAALVRLEHGGFDCVISDYDMAGMDGLELLRALRDRNETLPFVLFTGKGSEEIASEAISAGVDEYFHKGRGSEQYELLANSVRNLVESRRTEQALADAERMRATLIDNLPGIVYRCRNEPGWPMEFISEGVTPVTGYEPAAFVDGDLAWGDLIDSDRKEIWDEIQRARDGDGRFEVNYRIETRTGETRWLREQGQFVDDDHIEGFISDATERRDAERRARTRRERLRTIVENVPIILFVLDDEGRIQLSRGAGLEAMGMEPDEMVGLAARDFYSSYPSITDSIERALDGESVSDTTEIGDTVFDTWYEPIFDGDRVDRVIAVSMDVTERERQRRTLLQYRALVETAGDPMYALDAEGRVTMVNDAYLSFSGRDREELIGAHISELLDRRAYRTNEQLIEALLEDAVSSTGRYEFEFEADGDRRVFEDNLTVLTDEGGDHLGSVGVIRDVTDRSIRERTLKRQNERLESFASVVSHDLRNPLNVAVGNLELAIDDDEPGLLENALDSLHRMETLIDDLLSLARHGQTVTEPEELSLRPVALDAWRTVPTERAALEIVEDVTVEGDDRRLRQLLENLFRNSVEHGDGVTVRVGPCERGFFVADDGPGIDPEDRETVFEYGYSEREEGTGFGLAIVRGIAHAHGWTIELTESEEGGARFEFIDPEGD